MTFSNVSARRAARARGDRSVFVIAFMMALVFIPVLATHAAALALGPEGTSVLVGEGTVPMANLAERVFGWSFLSKFLT